MKILKKIIAIGALSAGLFLTTGSLYAVDCADSCGSISCPGAGWCSISYDTENDTATYECATGQTSTANNCIGEED